MASPDRTSPPSPPAANARRRSSFAGQFVDLFGRPSSTAAPSASASSSMSSSAFPGSITEAAAQAQRRRLSLTTIGLSGSPNQSSPFTARPRTESISSANSGSVDESPFEDSDGPGSSSLPPTPFGRRLSFGARALRDVRTGSVSGNGNAGAGGGSSGGGGGGGGGGFDFAENFRSRAERSSISAASGMASGPPSPIHQRAKSVATEQQPIQTMPKQPKVPDAIQERMLRGDFYMD